MKKLKKPWFEDFSKFFEKPTREGLKEVLEKNIGEFEHLDFKKEFPAHPKLAKCILAMSNSGGGCIVAGVEQKKDGTFSNKGVENIVDEAILRQSLQKFFSPQLEYMPIPFHYKGSEYDQIEGRKFQVILIEDDPKYIPHISETTKGEGIRDSAIYVRRGSMSIEANYNELQKIINRRIKTEYSSQEVIDLEAHLDQLKKLYGEVKRGYSKVSKPGEFAKMFSGLAGNITYLYGKTEFVPNPKYPSEDYEDFIVKMINSKKERIKTLLDVPSVD